MQHAYFATIWSLIVKHALKPNASYVKNPTTYYSQINVSNVNKANTTLQSQKVALIVNIALNVTTKLVFVLLKSTVFPVSI